MVSENKLSKQVVTKEKEISSSKDHNKDKNDEAEASASDEDVYNSLTKYVADAKKLKLKFRIRSKNDCVYLPDDFVLPKKTYDNLFDHQK